MLLKAILNDIKYKVLINIDKININNIAYDSRKIEQGDLFIAIKGDNVDGHDFIDTAFDKGAVAVIVTKKLPNISIPQIIVKNDRKTLSKISKNFFRIASEHSNIYGITGTNGKTSTAIILKYLLDTNHHNTGYIGTLGIKTFNDYQKKFSLTTPESLDIYQTISDFKGENIDNTVIEVSSIGLARDRVFNIPFKLALFTNLSQDHLDYHKTMDKYFKAKKKLFYQIKSDGYGIINIDDEYGKKLYRNIDAQKISFSLKNADADYFFKEIDLNIDNTQGIIHSPFGNINIQFPLLGKFNAYNLLGATASQLTLFPNDYSENIKLKSLPPIPGRMEIIKTRQHGTVIVDFAHTPDAMEKIFNAMKLIHKSGNINVAFGCGGNRDKSKRRIMGHISEINSNEIILTNDNPRNELPIEIINDIIKGIKNRKSTSIIEDRKEAISEILNRSKKGDIVLILGKGDERNQEINGKKYPFDDREIIKSWIKENEN